MRSLTSFKFFKNTPFIDFQNTILFTSEDERDKFFLNENHYDNINFTNVMFNFIRDRLTISLSFPYDKFIGVNYCTFLSEFEPDTRYYAYVIGYKYINDNMITVDLLIDGIMTHFQGKTINNLKNLSVQRKHFGRIEYEQRLDELKNNDDIIKTFTKKYTNSDEYLFDEFDMLIQCSADLTTKFGTVDNPLIETSQGLRFDKISSPLNIYIVKQQHFRKFMKTLSKYPWISQNIRSISMIPSILLEGKTSKVSMEEGDFKELYTLIDNGVTNETKFNTELLKVSKKTEELYNIFDLDPIDDRHLLRNEYTTTEIYTYDGQQLFINNGLLSLKFGLFFQTVFVSGFHNEIGIYVEGYKSKDNLIGKQGSFLNDAIFFKNFDDIPILIDNYNLALSKSANQRQLAEGNLISGRIGSVLDSGEKIEDRFYNATNILSNLSPTDLFGRFNDEHEFYKQQMAQHADLALETPTITGQSNNNSLSISSDFFGIHVKHAQPSKKEWEKVKKYYRKFGYLCGDDGSSVDLFTHTICNYVQFKGVITSKNVDVAIIEMVKAQFENGVRFWHNNNTPNPMTQNILNNKMR